MRFVARTGRTTGVAVGPVGLLVLGIGWLLLAALVAIGYVATCLVLAAMLGVDEMRKRRRRPRPATPLQARHQ